MMKPTKVWKFKQVYSVEVLDGNKLTAKVESIGRAVKVSTIALA